MTGPAITEHARQHLGTPYRWGQVRLVLVTGHTFGVRAFEGIFSSGAYIAGQLAVPLVIGLDESRAAGTTGYQSPERLAREQGCEFTATEDGRLTSLAGTITTAGPDWLLVIGWSSLVPPEVLAIPSAGCIGMHPAPLPEGRGRAPIPWTIIKGLERTALSAFLLDDGADTGDIVCTESMPVNPRETAASLFLRMAAAHFSLGREVAALIARGMPRRVPQDESAATQWMRRTPADGEILPSMTFAGADALIRAQLGPYPRAFITVGGARVPVRAVSRRMVPGAHAAELADGTAWLIPDGRAS
jgi:methionyl-tRNA formyltransferase